MNLLSDDDQQILAILFTFTIRNLSSTEVLYEIVTMNKDIIV